MAGRETTEVPLRSIIIETVTVTCIEHRNYHCTMSDTKNGEGHHLHCRECHEYHQGRNQ